MRGATCTIVPTPPDIESTGFADAGLPDDPNLEMVLAPSLPEDDGPTSGGAALFPEIPRWTDDQLVIAIELADRREPGLNLYPVGIYQTGTTRSFTSARRSWCDGWRKGGAVRGVRRHRQIGEGDSFFRQSWRTCIELPNADSCSNLPRPCACHPREPRRRTPFELLNLFSPRSASALPLLRLDLVDSDVGLLSS
jgi:hypothetical protein